jgi:hypothetical protein
MVQSVLPQVRLIIARLHIHEFYIIREKIQGTLCSGTWGDMIPEYTVEYVYTNSSVGPCPQQKLVCFVLLTCAFLSE